MLDHPAVIAVAIPMGLSLLAVAVSRALGRQPLSIHVLSIGGLAAFLVAYVMLMGWPDAMPRTATQKLGYVALAGLFAGFLLDVAGNAVRALRWSVALPRPCAKGLNVPEPREREVERRRWRREEEGPRPQEPEVESEGSAPGPMAPAAAWA